MVTGLNIIKEYFKGYDDQYIIIGGTACEIRLEGQGIPFRATRDIDLIFVIEVMKNEFLNQFWKLINDGRYSEKQYNPSERKIFRFQNPQADGFPLVLELFTRKPDGIRLPKGFHLTPIPTDEDMSSISAMLLDDDYYNLTISNCSNQDGLMVANELALICLKVKAYLNNKARKEEGHEVRSDDINKHKKDAIKLITAIPGDAVMDVTDKIKNDLKHFVDLIQKEKPDVKAIAKDIGQIDITIDDILLQLNTVFKL